MNSQSHSSKELSFCLCFCSLSVSLLFVCGIPVLSGPKAKAQVFQLPALFSSPFISWRSTLFVRICLLTQVQKNKLEDKRVEEWEYDGTPALKITPPS